MTNCSFLEDLLKKCVTKGESWTSNWATEFGKLLTRMQLFNIGLIKTYLHLPSLTQGCRNISKAYGHNSEHQLITEIPTNIDELIFLVK